MKIVVLDGYTLNPGDLSWEALAQAGDLTDYSRTEKRAPEILKAIGDAEIVITNKTPISAEVMDKSPQIRYIGVLATGYNVVDMNAAHQKRNSGDEYPRLWDDCCGSVYFCLAAGTLSPGG